MRMLILQLHTPYLSLHWWLFKKKKKKKKTVMWSQPSAELCDRAEDRKEEKEEGVGHDL